MLRFCLSFLTQSLWVFFFFSSRRRHTRYWRDWSSDVCSSDLRLAVPTLAVGMAVPNPIHVVTTARVDALLRADRRIEHRPRQRIRRHRLQRNRQEHPTEETHRPPPAWIGDGWAWSRNAASPSPIQFPRFAREPTFGRPSGCARQASRPPRGCGGDVETATTPALRRRPQVRGSHHPRTASRPCALPRFERGTLGNSLAFPPALPASSKPRANPGARVSFFRTLPSLARVHPCPGASGEAMP